MYQLRCKDVGFDCAGVVHGDSREAVLIQAARHAADHHGVTITPEMSAKVAPLITEAPAEPAPPGAAR